MFYSKDVENYDAIMNDICKNFLKLLKEHTNDERVIVPLYKTLDFLFEAEEFNRWKVGVPLFSNDLFAVVSTDIANSK